MQTAKITYIGTTNVKRKQNPTSYYLKTRLLQALSQQGTKLTTKTITTEQQSLFALAIIEGLFLFFLIFNSVRAVSRLF